MIATKLSSILGRIEKARAMHGILHPVRLVAVSKTKSVQEIKEAYDAGQRHFGENYVDELQQKQPQLPLDVKWHFIGHLQSNKIKKVLVPNLDLIQSVDREKQLQRKLSLAEKLNKHLEKQGRKLNVLIQVKTSGEDTKSGAQIGEVQKLYLFIKNSCPFLQVKGLMTIGAQGDLSAFTQLFDLKKSLCQKHQLAPIDFQLSMGMSGDFQEAVIPIPTQIAHNSTSVRVGSSIFGERIYKPK